MVAVFDTAFHQTMPKSLMYTAYLVSIIKNLEFVNMVSMEHHISMCQNVQQNYLVDR